MKIKVLHVHTLPVISGSGLNTFLSMKGQSQAGFEVELACAAEGPLLRLAEDNGMRVLRLRHMVWGINPIKDVLAVFELSTLISKNRYTIVHTHNSKAGFIGRLAARLAGASVIVHTVHGFAFHGREPGWKCLFYRFLERLAAGWCDKLIMISQPLMDWAIKERIGKPGQMVTIYSGIDLTAFRQISDSTSIRKSLGLEADDVVVGEVAKLWEGKGHAVLFQAATEILGRCTKLKLLLIGEGALRPSLEALAAQLGISGQVVFTGFREDVPQLTQLLDIAVLPSFFEGMGRAVIEAQAAGKPVVGSRVGGIPDLIQDGKTGLLVPAGDVKALADAIEQLYHDPELRKRLGDAAKLAAGSRFDATTMNQQIIQVYQELLANQGMA